MIVVDTNIISYLYISGEKSQQAERLLSIDAHWSAPVLWRSEFRSVLGLYLRKNYLSFDEVLLIIDQAEKLLTDNEYEVPSAHIMQLEKKVCTSNLTLNIDLGQPNCISRMTVHPRADKP